MTAPVSRDTPSVSGRRSQDNTSLPRSPDRPRFVCPTSRPDQADYQYLLNRKHMHEMKADGEIQGDR